MLTHTCQGQLYFRTSEIINKVKVTDEKKKKEDIFALNIKTILRLSSLFTSHKINCSSRCLKTTREIKGLKQNSNCYGERFVKINVDLSQFRCMPSSLEVQYYLVWFRSRACQVRSNWYDTLNPSSLSFSMNLCLSINKENWLALRQYMRRI